MFEKNSIIVCVDTEDIEGLTIGESYMVINEPENQSIGIKVNNNFNRVVYYACHRFITLTESRNILIDSLIK